MQNLGNDLRFTISVQVGVVVIVVMFRGIVVSSIIASSQMGRACSFVVTRGEAKAVVTTIAWAKFYWVSRRHLAEHAIVLVPL